MKLCPGHLDETYMRGSQDVAIIHLNLINISLCVDNKYSLVYTHQWLTYLKLSNFFYYEANTTEISFKDAFKKFIHINSKTNHRNKMLHSLLLYLRLEHHSSWSQILNSYWSTLEFRISRPSSQYVKRKKIVIRLIIVQDRLCFVLFCDTDKPWLWLSMLLNPSYMHRQHRHPFIFSSFCVIKKSFTSGKHFLHETQNDH